MIKEIFSASLLKEVSPEDTNLLKYLSFSACPNQVNTNKPGPISWQLFELSHY